ncbi:MAG TPA: hypothetical protein VFN61_10930, partial [Acidimicrobiales bacterium]|nr:hypothetical protein [Acidimicrobiales bacterium]
VVLAGLVVVPGGAVVAGGGGAVVAAAVVSGKVVAGGNVLAGGKVVAGGTVVVVATLRGVEVDGNFPGGPWWTKCGIATPATAATATAPAIAPANRPLFDMTAAATVGEPGAGSCSLAPQWSQKIDPGNAGVPHRGQPSAIFCAGHRPAGEWPCRRLAGGRGG